MSDPMHKMAEIRKKHYRREAENREFREGLMPWAQRLPWLVAAAGPRALGVAGVIAAVAGLSAWAMVFPVACALFQSLTDLPRRRRNCPTATRAWMVGVAMGMAALGAVVVHESGLRLAHWTLLRVVAEVIGWSVVSLGVGGMTNNGFVLVTLLAAPLPPEEARHPRELWITLEPDAVEALHHLTGDQFKKRRDEMIGLAVVHYAQYRADLGLDREPTPGDGA